MAARVSQYQMLKDIYDLVNKVHEETRQEIRDLRKRVDGVEEKTDNLLGKIGMGVILLSTIVGTFFTWIYETLIKR